MLTVLRGGVVFIKDTDAATVYGCCRKGMKVKTKKEEKCEPGNHPHIFVKSANHYPIERQVVFHLYSCFYGYSNKGVT